MDYSRKALIPIQRTLVCAICFGASCLAWADGAPTAVPVDKPPFPAASATVDSDWNVTFGAGETQRTMPLDDVVRWGAYRDSSRGTHVVLADGSLIVAELLEIGQETLTLDGELCGQIQVPIGRVRGVIFDPPVDAFQRDRLLQRIVAADGVADQVLLSNADAIQGALQGIRESGEPARTGESALLLVTDGHPLEISLDKALAIVFNPALTEKAQPRGRHVLMGFDDGSLLDVAQIDASGVFTQLTLACSVRLEVDPELIREELTYLLPLGGRFQYVSDSQPLSSKQIPWLDVEWPLRQDRSVTGGRLRSAGRIHAKGLGMHSASSVAYGLGSQYDRFDAELAIDQQAGLQGSVVFRVFLYDAAGKRSIAYESPVVRGGDAPLAMSVDVSGARAMALVVDFADRGHVLDHANWLNARLVE